MLLYQWTVETEDGPVYLAVVAPSISLARWELVREYEENYSYLCVTPKMLFDIEPVVVDVVNGLTIVVPQF